MDGIQVNYFFKTDNGKRFLYLKVEAVHCELMQFCNLFSEIGESLINACYENICVDLVAMPLVTSTVFGTCINIATLAKQQKKKLKFRFNADAMETARLSAFEELVEIEEGE